MKKLIVLIGFIALPSFAQTHGDSTAKQDSVEFQRRVHDEVVRTLHSLGISTADDSLQSDSDGVVERKHERKRHVAPDTSTMFHRMSIMERVVEPQPFNDWMDFEGFRYSRVDGLFLGIGSSFAHSLMPGPMVDSSPTNEPVYFKDALRPLVNFGYSFGSHYWQYQAGLSWLHRFNDGSEHIPVSGEIGFEFHKLTSTHQGWIAGTQENTAAALFAHEDFPDYYFKRAGGSATASLFIGKEQLSASFRNDNEYTLQKREYWSFFGGRKLFHENWPIPQGSYKSWVLTSFFDNVNRNHQYRGWSILAQAEFGGGDYTFNQYTLDVRRFQPVSHWSAINLRFRAGAVQGETALIGKPTPYIDTNGTVQTRQFTGYFTPWQLYYHLGGISTLPAFDYRELSGNRMMLINAEWNFTTHAPNGPVNPTDNLTISLLFDAGLAYYVVDTIASNSGWNQIALRNFKSDIGFGIGTQNGIVRFGWLWRTDKAAGGTFFIRLARPF